MADPFAEEMPRPQPRLHEIGQDLSMLSVDELEERQMLRSEIARWRRPGCKARFEKGGGQLLQDVSGLLSRCPGLDTGID